MKSRNVCKFLVYPTFVARHAKTPEILAAKVGTICLEGCPVIFLKWSFSRHLGICFWISKHVLVQITFFVSECSNYNLSLTSMSLDHDPNQVMKFVYMWSHRSLVLLNKGIKLELHLMKQLCVYSFELNFMCWNLERSIWHHKWWNSFNGILSKFKLYKR
jgi:hypothetical protein